MFRDAHVGSERVCYAVCICCIFESGKLVIYLWDLRWDGLLPTLKHGVGRPVCVCKLEHWWSDSVIRREAVAEKNRKTASLMEMMVTDVVKMRERWIPTKDKKGDICHDPSEPTPSSICMF